jgi:hypothetical protein
MATKNGLLGKAVSVANTYVTVYTAPVNAGLDFSTVNVLFCSRDAGDTTARLARTTTGNVPALTDFVLYDVVIGAGQSLEQTCIIMSPGESIVIYANNANLSTQVSGFEKPL